MQVRNAGGLRPSEKLAVDLADAHVLLWQDSDEIRAYDRRCPHLGVDLVDGYHDEARICCPGHGIAFSLAEGTSSCTACKLKKYKAYETDGLIYIARQAVAAERHTTA